MSDSGIVRNWSRDVVFGEFLVAGAAPTAGADTLFGTSSHDIILQDTDDLNIGGTTQTSSGAISGIEVVAAGDGNDIVAIENFGSATTVSYTLLGQTGDDVLVAGGGNDTLAGGQGSDSGVGDGADIMFGGNGDDVLWGDDLGETVGNTGDGNDELLAGAGIDTAYGAGGDDAIAGYDGNDLVFGGNGTDVLWGGAGNDTVNGDAATDYLYGGGEGTNLTNPSEVNTLAGGAGYDYYYVSRSDGSNTIVDSSGSNELVLFGQFGTTSLFAAGTGVHDTSALASPLSVGYVLGANGTSGGVNLSIVSGTATLSFASDGGNVVFNTSQIQTITLWDHDLTSGHTQEVYNWNGTTYAFAYYI
ncbi:MAG: calcium-binding protein [Alphaproteobacteria bacterium]|nr:calcium-binding protein [Alphaproteobacteria bacterium]